MLLLNSSWSTNALLVICMWCISASLFSCFESKSSLLSLVKKSNRNKLHNSASGLKNLSLNRQKIGGRRRMQMLSGRPHNSMQMLGDQSPNPMYNPYQQTYAPQSYQPYGAQYMPQYSPIQAPQLDMSQYGQLSGQGGSVMPLAAKQIATNGKETGNLFNIGRRGGLRLKRPNQDERAIESADANLTQADILKAAKSNDGKTADPTGKTGVAGRKDGSVMARKRTRFRSRFQKNDPNAEAQPGSTVAGTSDATSAQDTANVRKSPALDNRKPIVLDSTKPVVLDNTKPVVLDSTKPVVLDSTKPVVLDTTKPVVLDTTKPVVLDTTKPVVLDTTKPVVLDTTKPVVLDSTKPVVLDSTKPVVLDSTKPVVLDTTKPVVLDTTKPVVLDSTKQVVLDTTKPVVLDSTIPVQQSAADHTILGQPMTRRKIGQLVNDESFATGAEQSLRKRIQHMSSDLNSAQSVAITNVDKSSSILARTGSGLNAEVLPKSLSFRQFKGFPIRSNLRQKGTNVSLQGTHADVKTSLA